MLTYLETRPYGTPPRCKRLVLTKQGLLPQATATSLGEGPAEDRASSRESRASAMSVADFMRLPTLSL